MNIATRAMIRRNAYKWRRTRLYIATNRRSVITTMRRLQERGYIADVSITSHIDNSSNMRYKVVRVVLAYHNGVGAIHTIKPITVGGKPGYAKLNMIWPRNNGIGTCLVSTTMGITSIDNACRRRKGGVRLRDLL